MKSYRVKGTYAHLKKFLKSFNEVHSVASGLFDTEGGKIIDLPSAVIKSKYFSANSPAKTEIQNIFRAYSKEGRLSKRIFLFKHKPGYCQCLIPVKSPAGVNLCFLTSPFFLKKNDYGYFSAKTKKSGIDDKAFLDEIRKLPVCGIKYLERYAKILTDFAELTINLNDIKLRNKNVEKEHREGDRNYRELINLSRDSIGVHVDGKFVYVNKATVKMFEAKSAKELIGKSVIDIVHPDYREMVVNRLKKVAKLKVLPLEEIPLITLKGNIIRAEISAMLIEYKGRPAVQGVVRDVTAKRNAEEELLIRNIAMDSAINAMTLATPGGRLFYANKAFLKMWGYSGFSEISGRHFTAFAEIGKRARSIYNKLLSGMPFSGEGLARKKDGSSIDIQISANAVFSGNGKPVCIISSFTDISEKKKTEDSLKDSEERFRILSGITSDFAVSFKVNKRTLQAEWMTDSVERITGYNLKEDKYRNSIFPEDKKIPLDHLGKILKGREASFEFRILRKNGNLMWLNCHAKPILDERKKKVEKIYASFTDITDKKIAELLIKRNEERYRSLFENAPIGIFNSTPEGKILDLNPGFYKMLGYSGKNELIKKIDRLGIAKAIYAFPDLRKNIIQRVRKNKDWLTVEIDYIRKDGTVINGMTNFRYFLNPISGMPELEGFVTDITELKQKEISLKESEKAFRAMFENSSDAISVSSKGLHLFVNKPFLKLFGFRKHSEVLGTPVLDTIAPEQKEFVFNKISKRAGGDYSEETYETKGLRKDGSVFDLEVSVATYYLGGKKCTLVILRDISKSKRDKELMQNMINRYNLASEAAKFSVWEWDIINNKAEWDDRMYELYGLKKAPLNEAFEIWYGGIHPDDRENVLELTNDALKNLKDFKTEFRVLRPDGEIRYVAAYGIVVRDENGRPLKTIGVNLDITDKKLIEQALVESESKFSNAFKNSPVALAITYINPPLYVDVNDTMLTYFGYTRDEVIGKSSIELNIFEDFNERDNYVSEVMEKGYVVSRECNFVKKSGEILNTVISSIKRKIGGKDCLLNSMIDITEIKRAQKMLEESESKFRDILENIDMIAVSVDKEGNIIFCNDFLLNLTGWKRDEILGKNWFDIFIPEEVRSATRESFISRIVIGRLFPKYENVILTRKGDRRQVTWANTIVNNAAGEVTASVSLGIDVTEKKISEDKLRKSEENLSLAQKMAQIGSWEYDVVNNTAAWSENLFALLDADPSIPRESVMENYIEKIVHPDDRERIYKIISDSLAGKCLYNIEYKIIRRDGTVRIMKAVADIIRDDNGKPVKMIGWNQDVTDRKIAENIILENERRIRTLIGNVPGIVYRCKNDKDWTMEYLSEGCFEMTGYLPDELIGNKKLSYSDLILEDDRNMVWDVIQEALGEIRSYELQYRIVTKNRDVKWVWEKGSGVFSDKGELTSLEGLIVDITERKKMEEALEIAKDKAEEMNRVKASFFSTMSHELRTPMTGILGFAELLQSSLNDPEHKKMAGVIRGAGERLLDTLNMILDVSKIEADKLEIKSRKCNLSELVSETAELFRHSAEEQNLYFRTEIARDVYANVDEKLYRQAVSNLIKNAIKFTKDGGVKISLKTDKVSGNAVFNIADTGIGIPADMLDLIFEPFRQVSEGWGRKSEGTGLGLSITRKFIEKMGGEIKVESELNVGSAFSVIFPSSGRTDN